MEIRNRAGLKVEILDNGAVACIQTDTIMVSLRRATVYTGAYAGVWLRKPGSATEFHPLTGPGSNSLFRVDRGKFTAAGKWEDIGYICTLRLAGRSLSWEWMIDLQNNSGRGVTLDLVCLQDAGLKSVSQGLVNEYYVSQYTERRILDDPAAGKVVFCRQNMKESGGHPWLMMASLGRAVSGCTDGMQFYGSSYRATGIPEGLLAETLGGEYAGESSVVALQEEPFVLQAGETRTVRFAATFLHDHPPATSEADLDRLKGLAVEFSYDHRGAGERHRHEDILEHEGAGERHRHEDILEHEGAGERHRHEELLNLLSGRGTVSGLTGFRESVLNLFSVPVMLDSAELSDSEIDFYFPGPRRYPEYIGNRLVSFFYDENRHVMLRWKEILVDRPHGHIMHTRSRLVPDEAIMSTTAFAYGVFNSHITQGNTNFNTLLSVCNSQFNINPVSGQRIFIVAGGQRMLLGVPSAWEMGLNHCRWLYRYGRNLYQVRTWTSGRMPRINMDFRVLEGDPAALVVTHDFDELNGWNIKHGEADGEYIALPAAESIISRKFPDARFRIAIQCTGNRYHASGKGLPRNNHVPHEAPLFVVETEPLSGFYISFTGCVAEGSNPVFVDDAGRQFASDTHDALEGWKEMSRSLSVESNDEAVRAISEILPWFGMNALTHFLTPYGLEQFSGAAWGTRDVSQGPVELLVAMGKYDEAKKVLCIIFSNQEPDGGWPQWWMFDSYNDIRADSAHGDVIYWCLIALAHYIRATGDFAFLDEELPYYQNGKRSDNLIKPLREHVDQLVRKVVESFISGKSLVSYGGGDWNDSLQPVSRELADRLVSSWTVEMNYQAFRQYAEVCTMAGDHDRAEELNRYSEMIRDDFNRYLVSDGVVAGYGLAGDDGSITLLLHPSDAVTGIRYSLLPMERGIVSGIFTPEQASRHLELIGLHLTGPDGVRLMDRPLGYSGGIEKLFRRAESSTFFGREIGLMYVHEHIRYAESLSLTGKADEFLKALRLIVPVAYREVVPCGDIRQSNCYYSSSDVIFRSRYEADELYDEIIAGERTVRGGWRIYSSGPGIFSAIVLTRLFGLRKVYGNIIIDPVMPLSLDGITISVTIMNQQVKIRYSLKSCSFGPEDIVIGGRKVPFSREENIYRKGGAVIDADLLASMLRFDNIITVIL